jgi:hypothetical protein
MLISIGFVLGLIEIGGPCTFWLEHPHGPAREDRELEQSFLMSSPVGCFWAD